MRIVRILIVLVAVGLLSAASASADSLPINNAGFETPALSASGYTFSIPGWNTAPAFRGNVGVFYPGAAQYPGGIPEGNNVAFSKGPWISQTLTSTLQPNTLYTLAVDVGYRSDNSVAPFIGYTISLLAGNTVIATSSTTTPAAGQWITSFASYTSLAADPLAGQPLQILLTVSNPNGGHQVNFDNVRLDATEASSALPPVTAVPEPGTLALLGTGLIGLARRLSRR